MLASSFHDKVPERVPELLRESLEPILKTIASLSARIRDFTTANSKHSPRSTTRRPSCCGRYRELEH